MCTKGSAGQVSADMPTDMSVDARPILGRHIGRGSIECRSSVDRHIGRVLPSIGRLSVNNSYFEHRCIGRYRVDEISVNCRWYIGVVSASRNKQEPMLWILMT